MDIPPQARPAAQPEWLTAPELIPFDAAMGAMEQRVDAIAAGTAPELIWLLEHPPLYTAGTGAQPEELLDKRFPVYQVGRGGKHTYHGPGQRIVYAMINLNTRGRDVRHYVWQLEEWVIRALARLGVTATRRDENDDRRVGLWVQRPDGKDDKVAAIGIRVRKWVAFHGIAINVNPDLSHYAGIIPCGIKEHGITSLALLKPGITMADVDAALKETFKEVFK